MPEKLLLWPTAICHISLFCRTPLKLWFSDCATGCRRHYTACFTDPIELFITCKVTFCVKLMEVPFNKINSELKKKKLMGLKCLLYLTGMKSVLGRKRKK